MTEINYWLMKKEQDAFSLSWQGSYFLQKIPFEPHSNFLLIDVDLRKGAI